jgi:hypothetical protein
MQRTMISIWMINTGLKDVRYESAMHIKSGGRMHTLDANVKPRDNKNLEHGLSTDETRVSDANASMRWTPAFVS